VLSAPSGGNILAFTINIIVFVTLNVQPCVALSGRDGQHHVSPCVVSETQQ